MDTKKEKIGVVVGRFQVAELTDGHRQLLDWVLSQNYGTVYLILGNSPLYCTKNNPLDYESRRLMIEQEYPNRFSFLYIMDCPGDVSESDKRWSEKFDSLIDGIKGRREVELIGSRDCFYNHYFGKYKKTFREYLQKVFVSGDEQRRALSKELKNTRDWRSGVVFATQNQYPTVYSTVDVAIFHDESFKELYLAKKNCDGQLRFVGGFANPNDDSFEDAALREAKEESGLTCSTMQYICSQKVEDWRYRNEESKIITHLYAAVRKEGTPCAMDDIDELHLVNIDDINPENLVYGHRALLMKLKEWLKNKK